MYAWVFRACVCVWVGGTNNKNLRFIGNLFVYERNTVRNKWQHPEDKAIKSDPASIDINGTSTRCSAQIHSKNVTGKFSRITSNHSSFE